MEQTSLHDLSDACQHTSQLLPDLNGPMRNKVDQTEDKSTYRLRKATGLCTQGTCPNKAALQHSQCKKHLRRMARQAEARRKERLANGLCITCGLRPQFWGRKCIICRQDVAKNPLPSEARRALRFYREAESRRELEEVQREARTVARGLVSSQKLNKKQAMALRFYAGLDDGIWRTYQEVGNLMGLTRERVRQLLHPSKLAISSRLSDRVPWLPLRFDKSDVKLPAISAKGAQRVAKLRRPKNASSESQLSARQPNWAQHP